MGSRISAVLRAKEQTGLRVREGRYAKPLSVMGDATPTQFPSSNPQTAQLAPAINCNQSDRRTGRPFESRTCSKRLSGPRTASSSASNVIAVANGRFHQTGDSGVTLQG